MGTLKISGHSDDLVELEGDIEDEIDCYEESVTLTLNDGSIVDVDYGNNGFWCVDVRKVGDGTTVEKTTATNVDTDYSDVVVLKSSRVPSFEIVEVEKI